MANVRLHIDPSVGDPDHFREGSFVRGVVQAATQSAMWPAWISRVVVLSAHRRHRQWPMLDRHAAPPLVVALGNEDARVRPELIRTAAAILQQYVPDGVHEGVPVLHLPLGPGGPTSPTPPRPWSDRDVDVTFVGHLHRQRWPLARAMGAVRPGLRALPDTILQGVRSLALQPVSLPGRRVYWTFTERFGTGLPRAEYLRLLGRTRIALVPPGFKQVETFRHHEAAQAGCVLVGTPLPDARYPVLRLPEGAGARAFLAELLDRPGDLAEQHRAVAQAWEARGRAAVVGRGLAIRLAGLDRRDRPRTG